VEDVGIFYDHLVYFVKIWYIWRNFCTFDGYLEYFMVIWYIGMLVFGMLYQEKSGSPDHK
jgi:hypothetical protein